MKNSRFMQFARLCCRQNYFGAIQLLERLNRAVVIVVFVLPAFQSLGQVNLDVNTGTVIQNNFLGVNGVHNGTIYMNPQTVSGMTPANRAIVYDRLVKMGIKMVRTVYSPWYAARGNWNGTYDWNSTPMSQFYSWLQDMKDRNIDVALTLGYYFPADTYNWTTGITEDVTNNLNRIADWASQSIHQMVTVRGYTNVKYGILFTEPNTTPHDEVGGPPSGYTNWTYYKAVVQAIHNKLVADGRRNLIKLVGPNNTADGVNSGLAASELNGVIDIYSGHNYNKTGYTGWFNMATGIKNNVASTGKPYWIDEYGRQNTRDVPEYGNYIAQAVAAFINAGAQTSLIWQISEDWYSRSRYPGDGVADPGFYMNFGSDRYVPTSKVPYPSWYSFSLMSKYMGGPGTLVYSTTNSNSVYIAATRPSAGNYSFLVVNGNTTAQNIAVNISATIGGRTLYRYVYNPATVAPTENATLVGYSKIYSNVTTAFTDTIPASAVVIYSTLQGNAEATPGANGINFATGSTASASSNDAANGYSPAKAIDGDKANFRGWASLTGVPQWLLLDFGSNKTINRVVLNTTTGYLLKDYDVQYWNGSAFITAAQVRNNTVKEVTTTFTAVATSRVRIYCITGDQFNLARIDELEVYGPIPPTASASSTDVSNGYSPAKAIDGNKANFAGWASLSGVPQWLLLDYGANRTFDKVVLNTTTGYLLKDYDVQYWNGSSYVTAAQVRNNTVKEVITTFAPVTSSRVRINCITGDQFNLARIDELEVFNANAPLRLANGSLPSITADMQTVTADGYYRWQATGWVKLANDFTEMISDITGVWHIAKAGNVIVYDGRFAAGKVAAPAAGKTLFSFYPNPASRIVTIVFNAGVMQDAKMIIINAAGTVVKEQRLDRRLTAGQSITVNISDMSQGTYSIQLVSGNMVRQIEKLIISK